MHVKFAAGVEQAVAGEQFEDFGPRHVAGVGGELLFPKRAQAELLPGVAAGPAVAEATGRFDGEGGELDLDDVGGRGRAAGGVGEQPPLVTRTVFVQHREGVLPRIVLVRVQLAQMQKLALDRASAMHAQALADRVIRVVLAVFASGAPLEEHRGRIIAQSAGARPPGRSAHHRFALPLRGSDPRKIEKIAFSCESPVNRITLSPLVLMLVLVFRASPAERKRTRMRNEKD